MESIIALYFGRSSFAVFVPLQYSEYFVNSINYVGELFWWCLDSIGKWFVIQIPSNNFNEQIYLNSLKLKYFAENYCRDNVSIVLTIFPLFNQPILFPLFVEDNFADSDSAPLCKAIKKVSWIPITRVFSVVPWFARPTFQILPSTMKAEPFQTFNCFTTRQNICSKWKKEKLRHSFSASFFFNPKSSKINAPMLNKLKQICGHLWLEINIWRTRIEK